MLLATFLIAAQALVTFAHPSGPQYLNCLSSAIIEPHLWKRSTLLFDYSGSSNPFTWKDLAPTCGAGQQQSPINFHEQELVIDAGCPNAPEIDWKGDFKDLTFVNIGNTVEVEFKDVPNKPSLVFPSDRTNVYKLHQFHFHISSEHTVNAHAYPLEVHFVFRSGKGQLAVVGFFLEFAQNSGPFAEQVGKDIPRAKGQITKVKHLSTDSLAALTKSGDNNKIYRYKGSLTTPPCTEGVEWTVNTKTLPIGVKELNAFWDAMPFK